MRQLALLVLRCSRGAVARNSPKRVANLLKQDAGCSPRGSRCFQQAAAYLPLISPRKAEDEYTCKHRENVPVYVLIWSGAEAEEVVRARLGDGMQPVKWQI